MFNPGPYLFYLTFCLSLVLLELLWTGMKFQLGKTCQSHNFKIRLFFVIPSCRLKEDFYDMSSFRLISHKLCYNNCRRHSSPIVSTLNFVLRCLFLRLGQVLPLCCVLWQYTVPISTWECKWDIPLCLSTDFFHVIIVILLIKTVKKNLGCDWLSSAQFEHHACKWPV